MKEHLERWRRRWRDDVTFEQKAAIAVLFFGAVLVAGWLAADQLSSASAGVQQTTTVAARLSTKRVETVDKVVTVREAGKPVTTRVPVVKRVYVTRNETTPGVTVIQTQTAYDTRTVTVPTYLNHSITTAAQTVTQLVTTVEWRVITVVEKSPPVTVTVTTSAP
jgi:hypothetical protein